MIIRRAVPEGGLRAIEVNGRPGVRLRVITYKRVDTFGSLWWPGCLNDGLAERLPQLAWGHAWDDVVGRGYAWGDSDDGPWIDFYFDDFDAVPRARQAYAQVQSGTIDDCSVGFDWNYEWRKPTDDEKRMYPGVTEVITRTTLNEVSLVLRGAVPGAKVLAVRNRSMINAQAAADIMTQFAGGAIDLHTALGQVKQNAVELSDAEAPKEEEKSEENPTEEDVPKPEEESQEQVEPTEEKPEVPEHPVVPAEPKPEVTTDEPTATPAEQPTATVIDPPKPVTQPVPAPAEEPQPEPEPTPEPQPDAELEGLLQDAEQAMALVSSRE